MSRTVSRRFTRHHGGPWAHRGRTSPDGPGSVTHEDTTITWTGYSGTGTGTGHETITVTGTLASDLIVKAYGYAAGEAQVTYAWGVNGL